MRMTAPLGRKYCQTLLPSVPAYKLNWLAAVLGTCCQVTRRAHKKNNAPAVKLGSLAAVSDAIIMQANGLHPLAHVRHYQHTWVWNLPSSSGLLLYTMRVPFLSVNHPPSQARTHTHKTRGICTRELYPLPRNHATPQRQPLDLILNRKLFITRLICSKQG